MADGDEVRKGDLTRKRKISNSDSSESSNSLPVDGGDSTVTIVSPGTSCTECHRTSSRDIIQTCTSDWTEKTLTKLNVNVDTTNEHSLADLLDIAFNVRYCCINDELVNEVKERILAKSPLRELDIVSIESTSKASLFNLLYKTKKEGDVTEERSTSTSAWNIKSDDWVVKKDDVNDMMKERFYNSFHAHGEEFAQQLNHMSLCLETLTDQQHQPMYQCLFQRFASLLGLQSFCQPSLYSKQSTIRGTDVTSCPDIVFPVLGKSYGEMKMLAVCKVIHPNPDAPMEGSSRETRKLKKKKAIGIQYLGDRIIGQHGGDLVLHYPSSCNRNCLLGMIVQKTNVIFSLFRCTAVQYDMIMTGKEPSDRPIMYFSKPYNYLKSNDRKEMLGPMLRLGFLQGYPYCT